VQVVHAGGEGERKAVGGTGRHGFLQVDGVKLVKYIDLNPDPLAEKCQYG
jgi:hypothetical protein